VFVNLPAMNDIGGWLSKLLGLLITAAAGAQGSPFWFDLLKKLVNLRGSGTTPAAAPAPAPAAPAPVPAPAPAPSPSGPVG
ncbi:MAG TPA: hypothetical protein VLZ89_17150, partial [Anaerolineales bacterium]|nr:hypothetical protein [Anaerolineales bacterium]